MKKIAGILLLVVGLTLTIGAGANFRYYEAERGITVDIVADDDELIDLTPIQPYAYLNNGKLTVEISPNNPNYPGYGQGMSTNTTYVFEEMFNVSNELWENNNSNFPICVQISVTQGHLQIFAGNYSSPLVNPGTQIQFTVYHGQDVPVGFVFDNSNASMGNKQAQLSISAVAGACE